MNSIKGAETHSAWGNCKIPKLQIPCCSPCSASWRHRLDTEAFLYIKWQYFLFSDWKKQKVVFLHNGSATSLIRDGHCFTFEGQSDFAVLCQYSCTTFLQVWENQNPRSPLVFACTKDTDMQDERRGYKRATVSPPCFCLSQPTIDFRPIPTSIRTPHEESPHLLIDSVMMVDYGMDSISFIMQSARWVRCIESRLMLYSACLLCLKQELSGIRCQFTRRCNDWEHLHLSSPLTLMYVSSNGKTDIDTAQIAQIQMSDLANIGKVRHWCQICQLHLPWLCILISDQQTQRSKLCYNLSFHFWVLADEEPDTKDHS